MIRRPPRSTRTYTLFPYTTLFRSVLIYGFDMFGGKATLSANANYTKNQVTRAGPLIAGDRERLLELEDFVPDWKGAVNFHYPGHRIGFTTPASSYGKSTDLVSVLSTDHTARHDILLLSENS